MLAFAAAILISAFLLFQIQPIVAKAILAWFGGSPAVWTTCMLFFQVVLLGGYAYAHLISRLGARRRAGVHLGILALTFFWVPITVDPAWKPDGGYDPAFRILGLLATSIGAPYFALSATAPLLQSWAASVAAERHPYRLYALSNAGSLAALLTYPVLVEPWLSTGEQLRIWSLLYILYGALAVAAAYLYATRDGAPSIAQSVEPSEPPGVAHVTLWAALPACASVLLLAVTNRLCQEVAVIPFLWVLPLALYLLSFIFCFDSERFYDRRVFLPALALLSFAPYATFYEPSLALATVISFHAAYLFVACVVCHGELVRLRPPPERLTLFYLVVSLGGAAGGVFVGLAAPRLFRYVFELHLGVATCVALVPLAELARSPTDFSACRRTWLAWLAASLAIAALYALHAWKLAVSTQLAARNFYGTLRVLDRNDEAGRLRRYLLHGATIHGFQFIGAPGEATAYYAPLTGVGRLLSEFRAGLPRRIGAVGLGIGTIAAYVGPADTLRFFEINPLVMDLAETQFGFLYHCKASGDVTIADGRRALELSGGDPYDVLVLDAFSSDAIPVHLLTAEAFQLYAARLAEGGVMAVHATNRTLNLVPVIAGGAKAIGFEGVLVTNPAPPGSSAYPAEWVMLAKDGAPLHRAFADGAALGEAAPRPIRWRDDYSNLISILK
jgi:hypothetical protein